MLQYGHRKVVSMEEKLYTTYAQDTDITFILKDTYNGSNTLIKTEVVGFYYGEPNEIDTCNYKNNCLTAEF
jgi:hypothetical protein